MFLVQGLARDLICSNQTDEDVADCMLKGDFSVHLSLSPSTVIEHAIPIAMNHHRQNHNEADLEDTRVEGQSEPGFFMS